MLNIAVLVSGGGTNLQALLDSEARGENPNGKITLVVASKPGVFALERAAKAGVEGCVVRRKDYATSEEFDAALLETLRAHKIDLVVLAGFLSVLGPSVIAAYPRRILNVHPALIPSFCGPGMYGLRPHEAALARGCKVTGATVHFVNEECDGGPIVLQKAVEVLPDDTPGDNSLELVFMLLGGPNGANWVDGTSKTLTITGLILCPREPEDAGKTYLEGEWSFSLDSFYQGKEVEINTIGAVRWDEETERMVTLEGLTLSPLAASYTISYPVEESWEFVDLQLELVYKDGSSVTIDGGGGKGSHGPDGQGGTDYFTGVRNFDAPLDLRELDHLQYGGCRLEIPGEPRAVVEADTAEAVWYDETHQNTLVLEKLSFSSLSLTYRMHYDTPESATLADTGIRLVLADGTEIPVDGGSGTAGGTFMEGTTYFDAPVPLERVDHVLFGDIRVELK